MNIDLQLRMTALDDLDGFICDYCGNTARDFLEAFEQRLIDETVNVVDYVAVSYEPIESHEDDTAYVTLEGDHFAVVIDDRLQFGTVCDYLLHEFAHIGTWFVNEYDDHGPIFGVEWARLYRIYLEMYEEWFGKVTYHGEIDR